MRPCIAQGCLCYCGLKDEPPRERGSLYQSIGGKLWSLLTRLYRRQTLTGGWYRYSRYDEYKQLVPGLRMTETSDRTPSHPPGTGVQFPIGARKDQPPAVPCDSLRFPACPCCSLQFPACPCGSLRFPAIPCSSLIIPKKKGKCCPIFFWAFFRSRMRPHSSLNL